MIVIETLVVVGKPYDSSEHPAASVPLNEILGSNDCAGLNGAERWPLEAALIHNTGWVSPRLIPGSPQSLSNFFQICFIMAYAIGPAFCKQNPREGALEGRTKTGLAQATAKASKYAAKLPGAVCL
jgi:hypothetical protein